MTEETARRLPNEPKQRFTARWHAYELGRIAFREGDICVSPFESRLFYTPLTAAWLNGWDDEQDLQRQANTDAIL